MLKQNNYTKLIVTIGYILVVSLTILGFKLINNELINLSEVTNKTEESQELVIIGNTLVSLYKLEATTNLAATVDIEKTKLDYNLLMSNVLEHVDTLKKVSSDEVLNLHLDSILFLLNLKKENTWKMLQLLDSIEKKTIIKEKTKTTILSRKNIDDLSKILKSTSQTIEDTAIIKTEKKGFLRKVKDVFRSSVADSSVKISKNYTQLMDSLEIPVLTDTLTQFIDEIIFNNNKKNSLFTHQLVVRQNNMNQTNDQLTSQINKLMWNIERKEFENSLILLQAKEKSLRRSNKIVSNIGLLALGATLLFLFLSMRSLNRSQKYRKQLEESKKTTERLLVARERLILSITHDIKTPLSSIIGYLELLVKSKFPEKEKYYLENMQNSAEHVLDLVKNLLDYHVLESNKQTINFMSFSPSILVTSIYKSFIPLAEREKLSLNYISNIKEGEDSNYICDPYRLRQIISNLLSNAIKFTPAGGNVLLQMNILPKNSEKEILELSIKDNGPGISENDKKLIFEEFRRLSSSRGAEGTGLGLAITHKLVTLLNGEIDIISTIGEGSEFIVRIPIKKNDSLTDKNHNSSNKGYNLKLDIGLINKILFIDDDLVQLNLLSELMKYQGITPIICNNSLHALDLLQKEKFDIIFTDIQMPDMNGFELVERIRMGSFAGCKTVPVIALSGSSDMQIQEYIEAGFSGFLPKPFTSDQLMLLIQDFLGNSELTSKSSSETAATVGLSALSNFAGDDLDAGSEIIQSFIDENKQNLVILQEAFPINNWDTIQKTSHKMLPLMRMISANEIVSILIEYERGKQEHGNENKLFELLKTQIKEAEDFLSSLNKK